VENRDRLTVLKEGLAGRILKDGVGCFLCDWAMKDLEKHGKLTDVFPEKNFDGSLLFPAKAKKIHLELEGLWSKDLEFLLPIIDSKK
jgi:hypothetical protein